VTDATDILTFCVAASRPDAIVSPDGLNEGGTHSNQTEKVL
jgi:hypothetical protein